MAKKKPNIIKQFRESASEKPPSIKGSKSAGWINEKIKSAFKGRSRAKPLAGRMYIYMYDAKFKDKLPVWDRFPLIICIQSNSKYALGVNLHYIPPAQRQKLLEKLLKSSGATILNDKVRIKTTISALKSVPNIDKMVKLYLVSHIKSQVIEIPSSEWYNAIHLPTAQMIYN